MNGWIAVAVWQLQPVRVSQSVGRWAKIFPFCGPRFQADLSVGQPIESALEIPRLAGRQVVIT